MKNASERSSQSVIALVSCPLQKGVAAALVQFVYNRSETMVDYDQYVDAQSKRFFARLEWLPTSEDEDALRNAFTQTVARPFDLECQLHFSARPVRTAFSSRGKWHTCTTYSSQSSRESGTR